MSSGLLKKKQNLFYIYIKKIRFTVFFYQNNNNYNEMENTEVHTSVSENMLNFPTNIVVHKYTENEENYEEVVLKEIQSKYL